MIAYTSFDRLKNLDFGHRRIGHFLMSEKLNTENVAQKFQIDVDDMKRLMPPPNVIDKWKNSGGLRKDFEAYVHEYAEALHNFDMFSTVGALLNDYYSKAKDIIFLCSEDELTELKYMDAFAEILICRYEIAIWNPNELTAKYMIRRDSSEFRMTAKGKQMIAMDCGHRQSQLANDIPDAQRLKGRIMQYNPERGFGFIMSDNDDNLFFHVKQMNDRQSLPEIGVRVSFNVVARPEKERNEAVSIAILSNNNKFLHIGNKNIRVSSIKDYGIENVSDNTVCYVDSYTQQIESCLQRIKDYKHDLAGIQSSRNNLEDTNESRANSMNSAYQGFVDRNKIKEGARNRLKQENHHVFQSLDSNKKIYSEQISELRKELESLEKAKRDYMNSESYKLSRNNQLVALYVKTFQNDIHVFYQHESDFDIYEKLEELKEITKGV
jgi:cold shock CspA family protein